MTEPSDDIAKRWREDFPMLQHTMHGKPLVYLDSAATAQKPYSVIDATTSFYRDNYATVLRGVYELADHANVLFQSSREKVRRFLNARTSEEIIFCKSTTDAINMAAYSFGKKFLQPGDTILISEMEHHSNLVPWQFVCEERGALLHTIPIDEKGELCRTSYRALLERLSPKIVAVTHVSNVLGTVNPIAELAAEAHASGAVILVDGAQAAPHLPVDVQAADIDFYAFSGHKLYGPNGVGVLYGKEKLLNEMPPYQGGGSMVDKVTFETTTYNQLPWKFEAGTMMLAEVVGLGAAIDYIEKIGFEAIMAWESSLLKYAVSRLEELPTITIYGKPQKRESVVSFNIQGVHHLDLGTWLDLKGVAIRTGHHCAQPLYQRLGAHGSARLSVGLYNSYEDIDSCVNAIEEAIVTLR